MTNAHTAIYYYAKYTGDLDGDYIPVYVLYIALLLSCEEDMAERSAALLVPGWVIKWQASAGWVASLRAAPPEPAASVLSAVLPLLHPLTPAVAFVAFLRCHVTCLRAKSKFETNNNSILRFSLCFSSMQWRWGANIAHQTVDPLDTLWDTVLAGTSAALISYALCVLVFSKR